MKKWEYNTLNIYGMNLMRLDEYLSAQGDDGWELVAVDSGVAFFKRPLREQQFISTGGVSLREAPESETVMIKPSTTIGEGCKEVKF